MIQPPFYWHDAAFRAALLKLLSLPDDALLQLRRLTEDSFELKDVGQLDAALQLDDLPLITLVIRTLYLESQAQSSPDEVIQQIRERAAENVSHARQIGTLLESEAKRQALRLLIGDRPGYERRLERRAAQAAALPFLEQFSLFLDYRVVEGTTDRSPEKLVPVILARLTFDEPIQSSDAVAFQFSDELLEDIIAEIDRIRSLLKRTQEQFRERLF